MQLRQYLKLLALFVGAHLVIDSVGVVFALPRYGFSDSIFAEGLWMCPLISLTIAAVLFVYASMMDVPDHVSHAGLLLGAIKLYGLFLLVTGLVTFVSGFFVPGLFSPPKVPPSEIDNSRLLLRPFLIGGLKITIALLLVFKVETVARILNIRGDD